MHTGQFLYTIVLEMIAGIKHCYLRKKTLLFEKNTIFYLCDFLISAT